MHCVVMRWLNVGQQKAQVHLHLGDNTIHCDACEAVLDPLACLPHEAAAIMLVLLQLRQWCWSFLRG